MNRRAIIWHGIDVYVSQYTATAGTNRESKTVKREDMNYYGSISTGDYSTSGASGNRRYKITNDSILFSTGYSVTGASNGLICPVMEIYGLKGLITVEDV